MQRGSCRGEPWIVFQAPFRELGSEAAPGQAQARVEEYGQDLEPSRGYRLVSNPADALSFGPLPQ
jgi:hypothetical protein